MKTSGGARDALEPSSRLQEGDESMSGVGGGMHNAGGLTDVAFVVRDFNGGKKEHDDLLSYSQNSLQDLAV